MEKNEVEKNEVEKNEVKKDEVDYEKKLKETFPWANESKFDSHIKWAVKNGKLCFERLTNFGARVTEWELILEVFNRPTVLGECPEYDCYKGCPVFESKGD